jgi:hypothetical protein
VLQDVGPYPERGIGGESGALVRVVLLDGVDEAHVAFLDEVEDIQVGIIVFKGYLHHQLEIGDDELLGRFSILVAVRLLGNLALLLAGQHPIARHLRKVLLQRIERQERNFLLLSRQTLSVIEKGFLKQEVTPFFLPR